MGSLIRTTLVLSAASLLAACNSGGQDAKASDTSAPAASSAERTAYEVEGDHAMGSADAPVTIVEYASVSCGACANWHQTVYPELKKKYIDTGKVRYVFREFLAGQPQMADAGFMIALCAADEDYFKNIKLQFDRQAQMFEFAKNGQLREAYINLAKSSGLSEEEFFTCMQNQDVRDDYMSRMQMGIDGGVNGTPSFFINGKQPSGKTFTLESIEAVILPILGEDAPAETDESNDE